MFILYGCTFIRLYVYTFNMERGNVDGIRMGPCLDDGILLTSDLMDGGK